MDGLYFFFFYIKNNKLFLNTKMLVDKLLYSV